MKCSVTLSVGVEGTLLLSSVLISVPVNSSSLSDVLDTLAQSAEDSSTVVLEELCIFSE